MSEQGRTGVDVDREARVALIRGSGHNGIDFVELLPAQPRSMSDGGRTLLVHLLRGPVPAELDRSRVAVVGGVRPDPRINPVRVGWAYPAAAVTSADPPPLVTDADQQAVRAALQPQVRDRVLVVRTSSGGDWSTYVLRLLGAGTHLAPDGFDEPLAEIPFVFTVDCPSDLDCRASQQVAGPPEPAPVVDYLARDYAALRVTLLDRLAAQLPQWTDRSPADLGVTLAELFAYLGDRLAYWQDAVGVEAYLSTARRRTSVRRHARLLDYHVHDGCSARAWLAFTVGGPDKDGTARPDAVADVELPAGTAVADHVPATAAGIVSADEAAAAGAVVFETCIAARLTAARDKLQLHSWGDPDHTLPAGTTCAYVQVPADTPDLLLHTGDVLVLAEVGASGRPDSGDPARRYAVRLDREPTLRQDPLAPAGVKVVEVHWHPDDALRGQLRVSRPAADGHMFVAAVALANVVPADHGATVAVAELDPAQVPQHGGYRPRLPQPGLAWVEPYRLAPDAPAAAVLRPDPHGAVPQIELKDQIYTWSARRDLLDSGWLDAHLAVDMESDGVTRLRFGDGVLGRQPIAGTRLQGHCRIGGGTHGNVAAGQLTKLLRLPDGQVLSGISVDNPIPAAGGTDPQPIAEARNLAPHAFRGQLRAVTPADYAAVASVFPTVQRAVARRRWTGSWYAHEVMIDPIAGHGEDATVGAQIATALQMRRMAGVDVETARPVYVPLEIVFTAHVHPGYSRSSIAEQLRQALGTGTQPDGRRGFFHPDNFTFGQPVYLSDVVAAVMAVPGVARVEVDDTPGSGNVFGRWGRPSRNEVALGRIEMAPREVARADSDPSNPENGRAEVLLEGGEA
ncbi:putative baseplate assembly protein [Catellatospora chokoriensis]|uniref:Putative baseplate assembly protein n=1 Tax=Catellatospora chokoriensis TaxID=310353 RepID=A0A8J3K0T4_9ACTN|nr:putative baseplate assembly protein [Catellatospora chokoriensis]GIF90382.1 putative baseplate assembly protein [Catellatospora chokoriensis]